MWLASSGWAMSVYPAGAGCGQPASGCSASTSTAESRQLNAGHSPTGTSDGDVGQRSRPAFRGDRRLRPHRRGRRNPDLRADAAERAPRARPVLRRGHGAAHRAAICGAGQLVVLESTTYPGTTREVVRPILEARGLEAGEDFFLAFSPEREDPGNPNFEHRAHPEGRRRRRRRRARALARALYGSLVDSTVPVSSADTAEAVKLTENIFRAVNIALVNELKMIFDAHGHRRLGGDRRGQDQAVRLHAVLSGPRPRRPLHPDRPVLSDLEGARVRLATRFIELAGEINTRTCRTGWSSSSPTALDRRAARR